MADRQRTQQLVKDLVGRVPLYILLPPGQLRSCAAVHYLDCRSSLDQLCRILEFSQLPTSYLSASLIAARSALELHHLELADQILSGAAQNFQESAELFRLWTDVRGYLGDYPAALEHSVAAHRLEPSSPDLAAAKVRWHYWAAPREEADRVAGQAVGDFPRSTRVLWEACAQCRSEEQFRSIRSSWEDAAGGIDDVPAAVRPLASAAAHSRLLVTAVELYARGIVQALERGIAPGGSAKPTLEGKDPWAAIGDVAEALSDAGIPHFFANGTALGLVREGGPLSHDTDVDVGVFDGDWSTDALLDAFRQHPGFVPFVRHPSDEKLLIRHRTGTPIDVFRYFEEDAVVWHAQAFVRWTNTPFEVEDRSVSDRSVRLPSDADRYLTECYGDWRTPDLAFDAFVDAPNVEVAWSGYEGLLSLRLAYERFCSSEDREELASVLPGIAGLLSRTAAGRRLLGMLPG